MVNLLVILQIFWGSPNSQDVKQSTFPRDPQEEWTDSYLAQSSFGLQRTNKTNKNSETNQTTGDS